METVSPQANSALILVDLQKACDEPYWSAVGPRNNIDAESKLSALLSKWRRSGRPVIFVRHDSVEKESAYRPDTDTHAFKDGLGQLSGEYVVGKTTNSGFIGTELEHHLRQNNINQLFFVGVKTNNCVEATVRVGANLGFDCSLVEDCCFTFAMKDYGGVLRTATDVHNITLANLQGEYCQIITSDNFVF